MFTNFLTRADLASSLRFLAHPPPFCLALNLLWQLLLFNFSRPSWPPGGYFVGDTQVANRCSILMVVLVLRAAGSWLERPTGNEPRQVQERATLTRHYSCLSSLEGRRRTCDHKLNTKECETRTIMYSCLLLYCFHLCSNQTKISSVVSLNLHNCVSIPFKKRHLTTTQSFTFPRRAFSYYYYLFEDFRIQLANSSNCHASAF